MYIKPKNINNVHLIFLCFKDNCREDGRGCEDYRHMTIETAVVSNTSGSSRVRLVCITETCHMTINTSVMINASASGV